MIKKEIGINAGLIWEYLNTKEKEVPVVEIKENLGFNDEDINLSLGWLAREDKIFIIFKENDMFIELWKYCEIKG